MNRRDSMIALLAIGAAAGSRVAGSQVHQSGKPYRIALLPDFPPTYEPLLRLFAATLRESGRIEGRDFVLYRPGIIAGEDTDQVVRRVVEEKPDLIFARNLGYVIAAHKLTKTIPIVMWISGFPVEGGVAVSLARPGKNVTGLTIYAGTRVFGKLVQLLREAKPGVKRIGALCTYVPPFHPAEEAGPIIHEIRDAGRSLGVDVRILEIAKSEQLADALAAVVAERVDALLLTSGVSIARRLQEVTRFAIDKRLPTIIDWRWPGIEPPPLLSYAPPPELLIRQATDYVVRILWGGANPGELAIQLPSKFGLVANLRTARAIGLTLPQPLLLQADEVIG